MIELRPCVGCRRHVRVEETQCPFCAIALSAAPPARKIATGRFTRAAVFAGATALAATAGGACDCSDRGGSHGDSGSAGDTGMMAGDSGGTDSGGPMDAGGMDAGRDAGPPDSGIADTGADHFVPLPYGAPPARDRLA